MSALPADPIRSAPPAWSVEGRWLQGPRAVAAVPHRRSESAQAVAWRLDPEKSSVAQGRSWGPAVYSALCSVRLFASGPRMSWIAQKPCYPLAAAPGFLPPAMPLSSLEVFALVLPPATTLKYTPVEPTRTIPFVRMWPRGRRFSRSARQTCLGPQLVPNLTATWAPWPEDVAQPSV